ncbi:MAG: WG repeat-containing protein [Bacillota bacterium]|nr:WG repeat-containing protein [Bacillota bacterium]
MKKTKIYAAVFLVILILLSACTGQAINKKPFITAQPSQTAAEKPEAVSETLYGCLKTPYENFRITPDISKADYPVKFEKDGKFGFKDKNGNIISDAVFFGVNDFWNGVASVRVDKNGGQEWRKIGADGKLFDYDEVNGFFFGLSQVEKNGKYGFINTAGELVVPLIYDELFCSYTDNGRSTYALKDGAYVYLNLTDGYEESFEKYDPVKKAEYIKTVDLTDYNVAAANGMLIVNGISQPNAIDFPIIILRGLDFDLYTQDKKLGTFSADIVPGVYEGELFLSFPGYKKTSDTDTEEYYAVLSQYDRIPCKVKAIKETQKINDTAKRFLKDNQIENAPFEIDKAFEGDFFGSGITGAVFEVNDSYRKESNPRPINENWTKQKFKDGKTAFFNAIIIIDDINKLQEYRVIKSNIWANTEIENMKTEGIGFIANLDEDCEPEILISNGYYEYRDYAVCELK